MIQLQIHNYHFSFLFLTFQSLRPVKLICPFKGLFPQTAHAAALAFDMDDQLESSVSHYDTDTVQQSNNSNNSNNNNNNNNDYAHIDPSLQPLEAFNNVSPSPYATSTFAIPFHAPYAQGNNNSRYGPPLRPVPITDHYRSTQITEQARSETETPQQNPGGGQFGILRLEYPETPLQRFPRDGTGIDGDPGTSGGKKEPAHFTGMKKVLDPPNLQEWREKLFSVNEIIYLTEDE